MDDFAVSAETMVAENELLRNEIEQLQLELAEREALLAEAASSAATCDDPFIDETATSELVDRLEQLLDELERSDGRIGALEKLLLAAEETSHAEQEERRQSEAWVTDIETRIIEREQDWEAEARALRRRVEDSARQRDQLMREAGSAAPAASNVDPDRTAIGQLCEEKAQLQRALDEAHQERTRLAEKLQQQQSQLAQAGDKEDEVREERLKLAQQRAALTREQAEVTALREDFNSQPSRTAPEIDNRLRVFREHLREIHDKEQQNRHSASLATRVSQIWKRLERR